MQRFFIMTYEARENMFTHLWLSSWSKLKDWRDKSFEKVTERKYNMYYMNTLCIIWTHYVVDTEILLSLLSLKRMLSLFPPIDLLYMIKCDHEPGKYLIVIEDPS